MSFCRRQFMTTTAGLALGVAAPSFAYAASDGDQPVNGHIENGHASRFDAGILFDDVRDIAQQLAERPISAERSRRS